MTAMPGTHSPFMPESKASKSGRLAKPRPFVPDFTFANLVRIIVKGKSHPL